MKKIKKYVEKSSHFVQIFLPGSWNTPAAKGLRSTTAFWLPESAANPACSFATADAFVSSSRRPTYLLYKPEQDGKHAANDKA